MAMEETDQNATEGGYGMRADTGEQTGDRRREGRDEGHLGRRARPGRSVESHGSANLDDLSDADETDDARAAAAPALTRAGKRPATIKGNEREARLRRAALLAEVVPLTGRM